MARENEVSQLPAGDGYVRILDAAGAALAEFRPMQRVWVQLRADGSRAHGPRLSMRLLTLRHPAAAAAASAKATADEENPGFDARLRPLPGGAAAAPATAGAVRSGFAAGLGHGMEPAGRPARASAAACVLGPASNPKSITSNLHSAAADSQDVGLDTMLQWLSLSSGGDQHGGDQPKGGQHGEALAGDRQRAADSSAAGAPGASAAPELVPGNNARAATGGTRADTRSSRDPASENGQRASTLGADRSRGDGAAASVAATLCSMEDDLQSQEAEEGQGERLPARSDSACAAEGADVEAGWRVSAEDPQVQPKQFLTFHTVSCVLSAEQRRVREDCMRLW